MATTITRASDSDSLAGTATNIALDDYGASHTLSAVRTGSGSLKLIGWRTGNTTVRLADSGGQAGAVSEIALTKAADLAVTAVRAGDGTLKLISWSTGSLLSSIVRRADSGDQAGEATRIVAQSIGSVSDADVVTPVRTAAGSLKLISWKLTNAGHPTISRLGDSGDQAGAVGLIAASVKENIIVTAVRTASSTLKLIAWRISPDGKMIERRGDSGNQAGEVSEIAMAGTVTAVRTGDGTLKVIDWRVSSDGSSITRTGDSGSQAGAASNIGIARVTPTRYLTAVRDGGGHLKLIAFDMNGGAVTRNGDSGSQAGAVSDVNLVSSSQNFAVTAVRDGGGNLKLICWST